MKKNIHLDYVLEVQIPEQTTTKYSISDHLSAGLDPRSDIILIHPKIKERHFLFFKKENLLTLQFLGTTGSSFINGISLEQNKSYLLEVGDVLKVGKIKIIIRFEKSISKTPVPPEKMQKVEDTISELAISRETPKKVKSKKEFSFNSLKYIPFKLYAFIINLSLTYFILSFIISRLNILESTQNILYPITKFIYGSFFIKHPELSNLKILSVVEFFICFHLIMVFTSLILGATFGEFLIGLDRNTKSKNFLAIRFKAYLYALINIIPLPLLIFSNRTLASSSFFKISRRAIAPMFVTACFFSPFFMGPPYTSSTTLEKLIPPKYKDVHTTTINSTSSYLGLELKAELNEQYALLPFFSKNKIGFILYNLKNNKSITIAEEERLNLDNALFKLRYANPMASLTIPNDQITNELLKNKSFFSLTLNLDHFIDAIIQTGPFVASSFLFKSEFLKNFKANDNFMINVFDEKNPALKISSINKSFGNEEKIFLFTNKDIIEFKITPANEAKLIDTFCNEILNGLRFNQATSFNKLKNPQILEIMEAFLREDYQTILTYYIIEAKKALEINNPSWRTFLRNNALKTKLVLSGSFTKNIEKSFDDIINSL